MVGRSTQNVIAETTLYALLWNYIALDFLNAVIFFCMLIGKAADAGKVEISISSHSSHLINNIDSLHQISVLTPPNYVTIISEQFQ